MADVRYVILSDLHLGARNGLLTALRPGTVDVDPLATAPVLDGLAACLEAVVAGNEGGTRPTLVLAGDVLELALAGDDLAAMVFERFIERVLPARGASFAAEVWFVAGNHDHHLWETARERQYADFVAGLPAGGEIPPPWHTTRMLTERDPRPVSAQLLQAITTRAGERSEASVRIVYPNLGIVDDTGRRAVAVHHGHYVESVYRMMTILNGLVFSRPPPTDIADWEAQNFAWIDFLWSALGRSGQVGEDVALLYDMIHSDDATRDLVATVSRNLSRRTAGNPVTRFVHQRVMRFVLGRVARRLRATERHRAGQVLSADAERGLAAYLGGPLFGQLATECDNRVPDDVTFVFGHTHKPFERSQPVPGYGGPVHVYNTGGWVVDGTAPDPVSGAAAVLVDTDLDVASLRLFDQAADPASYRVRVAAAPGREGGLAARLTGLVDAGRDPWRSFSAEAAAAVAERQQVIARVVAEADRSARGARSRAG